jgi:thiol:disulfide interchange protein
MEDAMEKSHRWWIAVALSVGLGSSLAQGAEGAKKPASGSGFSLFRKAPVKPAGAEHPAEVEWLHDPQEAFDQAEESGRPVLLVLGGKRCSWCRKLEKDTLADAKVSALIRDSFVPLHVNAEDQPDLAEVLAVESYPTTIVLTADGGLVSSTPGYLPAVKYRKALQQSLAKIAQSESVVRQASGEVPLEKPSKRR